ncbi:MAG TPA: hypothetical protein VLL95_07960, partial [Phnomibacter sp.]|nr:hypothetical protein [Phnomibacter sp.]
LLVAKPGYYFVEPGVGQIAVDDLEQAGINGLYFFRELHKCEKRKESGNKPNKYSQMEWRK